MRGKELLILAGMAMSYASLAQDGEVVIRYQCGGLQPIEVRYSADGKSANMQPQRVLMAQAVESGIHFAGGDQEIRGSSRENVEIKIGRDRDFIACEVIDE